jgi:hypothetical protein
VTPPGGLPQLREEAVDPAAGGPDAFPPHDSAARTDTVGQADAAVLPDAVLPDAAETDSVETETDQDREQSSGYDYWDSEVDAQLAGQVYPVGTDTEVDLPAGQSLRSSGDGDANGSDHPPTTRELDDDAPPFATAPFATVPRLNRVRATPIPPADADEDEDS